MTVLDPFMGSATTAIACIEENRNFIGFEMIEKNFNIAKERVEKKIKEKEFMQPSLFEART